MKVRHTLTALVMIGTIAAPAAAQVVDVRVKVDTQAIREATEHIREALRDAFGPEIRMDLRHEIASVTRDVAGMIGHLSHAEWIGQRNFPASQMDKETRTFAIGANGSFELDNLSGDIRIAAGSGRDLTIEITRQARGRTEADARAGLARVRVETTHRGDRATARTVYPNERQSNYSVSVDYVITAPAGTRIIAKNVSGDLTVTRINGEISVNTTSGDVTITDADRVLTAKTVSGDIVLRNVGAEGLLEASTMSGDVTATAVTARRLDISSLAGTATVRDAKAAAVTVKSMAGDVVFDGDLAAGGRYEFQSQSGTVRLALDGRTGFTFEARTFAGSVTTEIPLKVTTVGAGTRRATRNLSGTFGDGSATVTATSFSGSVVVTKR